MPEGYRCPFCPDHDDVDFVVWEGLLAEPVCQRCTYEIFNAFLSIPPVDLLDAGKIPRLAELTGQPPLALAMRVVQEDLAELKKTEGLAKKNHRYKGVIRSQHSQGNRRDWESGH